MKILKIIRSKIIIFLIQFTLLSLFLIIFEYSFEIEFDSSISVERKQIIQFLANYVMFEDLNDTFLIYGIWLLVSTIPNVLFREVKKIYSMNLLTFFFPNFFFYVFLSRYSPLYFNEMFGQLFFKTLILATSIITYSIIPALIINFFRKIHKKEESIKLFEINKKVVSVCPKCGTEFDSKPLYCYKCNAKLIDDGASALEKQSNKKRS